jgi:uncharacterized membrane-anchored protein YhcB (DUF1043 family)
MSFQDYQDYQKKPSEFRLRMARIAVAVVLFFIFCWLNWWVMPYQVIARFDEMGVQVPGTCYLLAEQKNNKVIGFRVFKSFEYDWDSIPAAWPYMVASMIPALGIGYCIGELARRKFSIDEASKKALSEANLIKLDADKRESEARIIVNNAGVMVADLFRWKNYFDEQLKICRAVTVNSEEKIRYCNEKLDELPKVEQELKKAKGTIEKLNQRISKYKANDKKTNG